MVRPTGTYRVQLGPVTGFDDLADLADYLGDLGVSHAYLSPILAAVPGSTHGYDAVDHSRVSDELGGEDGFRAAARALARRGIGVLVDVVPNHMAIPVPEHLNRQLWSVLADGEASPFASWFDVDWSGDGQVLLPVLGQPLPACVEAGEITVDPTGSPDAGAALAYFDHRFPLAPGTSHLGLDELLAAQHYRLVSWRRGNDAINYRRFFDVDTLVGLRVEDPAVFTATHEVLLRLHAEGLVDGFRIDHVDGLVDPRGYLARLVAAAGQPTPWVVVEKILLGDETLATDWPCDGTTGYDALWRIGGQLVDPVGALTLHAGFVDQTGETRSWQDVEQDSRRLVLTALLGAEVDRLVALALTVAEEDDVAGAGEPGQRGLTDALVELLVAIPVYRLYVVPGEAPTEQTVAGWDSVAAAALERAPHRAAEIALVRSLALGELGRSASKDEFVVRLQQTCGPAVAKGVEDTAGYRWSPVTSLNEVGSAPDRLGVTAAELHRWAAERAADEPLTMNALSTHDTKRSEDVRARIDALTERPDALVEHAARWSASIPEAAAIEPSLVWILWQTLVGVHPISLDRLQGYLRKAARESKTRTSWLAPDADYESALDALAAAALADAGFVTELEALLAGLEPAVTANVLGQRALQLMLPGVPDTYQGSEALSLQLVDPDNRGRPDWASLQRDLRQALAGPVDPAVDLSLAKLRLSGLALNLRRDRPDAFDTYRVLTATGARADHLVGIQRGGVAVTTTRLALGLRDSGGWADTRVDLEPGTWIDVLAEREHQVGADGAGARALHLSSPVALLVRQD